MTMTDERLAELDAVMAKATDGNWGWCAAGARLYASPKGAMYSANVLLVHDPKWQANETDRAAIVALHNVYPDLRAHIEAQAATIARQAEALREAQGWFAEYAVMHLDKNTPEGVAKAASNARKAEYCAAALTGAA